MFSLFLTADGYVSRIDGVLLVMVWAASMFILRRYVEQEIIVDESAALDHPDDNMAKMVGWLIIGFSGVGIGSYLVIESTISLSRSLGVSEYLISFFMLSIGTSLPELVVGISAIRKRHFDLAVGDIIGSCIVDSTLAIGLGPRGGPRIGSGAIILRTRARAPG